MVMGSMVGMEALGSPCRGLDVLVSGAVEPEWRGGYEGDVSERIEDRREK
jgi:hypothetical protein